MSPLFFLECDNDKAENHLKEYIKSHTVLTKIKKLKSLFFPKEKKTVYAPDEISDFYINQNSDYEYYNDEYKSNYQYFTKGIFSFLNIKLLEYPDYADIVYNSTDLDGKKLEVILRETVKNKTV